MSNLLFVCVVQNFAFALFVRFLCGTSLCVTTASIVEVFALLS